MEEARLVRKHDHLRARLAAAVDLMDGVVSAKAVHACERIVKDCNLVRAVRILLELGQEEGQSECAPVASTERVFETRPVGRRLRIA